MVLSVLLSWVHNLRAGPLQVARLVGWLVGWKDIALGCLDPRPEKLCCGFASPLLSESGTLSPLGKWVKGAQTGFGPLPPPWRRPWSWLPCDKVWSSFCALYTLRALASAHIHSHKASLHPDKCKFTPALITMWQSVPFSCYLYSVAGVLNLLLLSRWAVLFFSTFIGKNNLSK